MQTIYQTKASCDNCIHFRDRFIFLKDRICSRYIDGRIKEIRIEEGYLCEDWRIQPYKSKFELLEKIILRTSFDEWKAAKSLL